MNSRSNLAPAKKTDPTAGEFEDLLERLLACYRDLLAREEQLSPLLDQVPAENRASARNLVHYLALRSHDLEPLQQILARLGLSSLGRAESHVLANIEAVLRLLCLLLDRPSPPFRASTSAAEAETLLKTRTEILFGTISDRRPSSIMITMPREAGENFDLVRRLLVSGMNCMRINCAHDDRIVWEGMIANVRQAERELGKSCRVLMDIPGPRVRTGSVAPGPQALKLRPTRDALGWVTAPAEVLLVPAIDSSHSASTNEPQISVGEDLLSRLGVGDEVTFRDTRGAARSMIITSVDPRGCRATMDQTAYVGPGTRLTAGIVGPDGARSRMESTVAAVPTGAPAISLAMGDLLALTRSQEPGRPAVRDAKDQIVEMARIPCAPPEALDWMEAGQAIWFDDGKIGGVIRSVTPEEAVIEILSASAKGDHLGAAKGINLPDTEFHFPSLTEQDRRDLPFIAANADLVGYSFVRTALDVETLQQRLRDHGAEQLGIVLKIETREAYENLPQILLVALRSRAAGVMIARGDLAVECGFTRLAEVQEEILWLCEAAHLPVIWATQVLDRLAKSGRASRAEVTDAAMGERAECVMLNKGDFIIEAVEALDNIISRMQHHQHKKLSVMGRLELAERFFASPVGDGDAMARPD